MKNKKGIIIFSIALVIGIAIGTSTVIEKKQVKAEEPIKVEIPYTKKGVFKNMGDDWVYIFDILDFKDKEENMYVFDGYNLKYTYLDEYSVKTIDGETGEVLHKSVAEIPSISINDDLGSEVRTINEYFNEKQFVSEITCDDLIDLKISHFKKELLVELYNKAFNSTEKVELGKYSYDKYLRKEYYTSTNEEMAGNWELTYINDYGNLSNVNIDFKYLDGTYLSDKDNSDFLSEIEKQIEEKQSFDCTELINSLDISVNTKIDINSLLEVTKNEVNKYVQSYNG